ncbi:MAG: hypothetical protein IBJ11_04185 [Phycisphaerales bacterium]|nr:hypothetical protein [Phycisphaerales bacterium]
MDAREAYERAVYRKALLLTGESTSAARVLGTLLSRQPDLARSSDSRLWRAVVEECRAIRTDDSASPSGLARALGLTGAAAMLWSAVERLGPQQREAFVLRDLEDLDEVPAAKAMDCSRTALEQVHRRGARQILSAALGSGYESALAGLRVALDSFDPSAGVAGVKAALGPARARRRLVVALQLGALLLCMGLLIWVLHDLLQANERERRRREVTEQLREKFSLPMRPGEALRPADAPPPAGGATGSGRGAGVPASSGPVP